MAGQRCGINLAGNDLRKAEMHRGDWLVAPALAEGSARLGVQLVLAPGESVPLRDRMPVHFHLGAADITGRLYLLQDAAETVEARHAHDAAQPARSLFAALQLDAPVVAVRGDRFVLRDQSASRTLAGGVVLEPLPFPGSPSSKLRCTMLEAMTLPTADAALQLLVQNAPEGIDPAWFRRSCNLPALETTLPSVDLPDGRTVLVEPRQWSRLRQDVVAAVAGHHAAAPAENGAQEAMLLAALPARSSRRLFNAAVETLLREGALQRRGNAHALPGFEPQLPGPDRALLEKVTIALVRHGLQAPAVHDFCGELGLEPQVLKEFLERMARAGHLVKVGKHRYYRAVDLQQLASLAETLANSRETGCFSAADFRDHCGIGRNTVIEVLEHFDRAGLTRRHGQVRRLRRRAAGLFAG